MTTNTSPFDNSLFINTPPPFDGDRFELWKARFEIFIKAYKFEMCDILNSGHFIPTFSFNDEAVNKHDFGWIKEDLRKFKLGFKLKHHLINTWSSKEFYYVFTCESNKKVLDTLEIVYGVSPNNKQEGMNTQTQEVGKYQMNVKVILTNDA